MKVFISYATRDRELAEAIVIILKEAGIDYFLDSKDIGLGDNVPEKISGELKHCSHLLVIITPASLKSPWVQFEIGLACANKLHIISYLQHQDLEIPDFIRSYNYTHRMEKIKEYFTNPEKQGKTGEDKIRQESKEDDDNVQRAETVKSKTTSGQIKILLLDDDSDILTSHRRSFENEGFVVMTTSSRREAEKCWQTDKGFQIALVDLQMADDVEPGKESTSTGFRVIRSLKNIDKDRICSFAAFSAYDNHSNLVEALQAGCDAFICKSWEIGRKIENIKSLIQKNRDYIPIINTTRRIFQMRSPYTVWHCDRVMAFCKQLIIYLTKLKADAIDLCACLLAAGIHDIGKISLPDNILMGSHSFLTREEKRIVQNHVWVNHILADIGLEFRKIVEIILYHHLFFNAPKNDTLSDYPLTDLNGNPVPRGEKIPIEARIIKVADYVDALLSERLYRSGKDLKQVKEELKKGEARGEFDPVIVQAFFDFTEDPKSEQTIRDIMEIGGLKHTHNLQLTYTIDRITLDMMDRILMYLSDIFLEEGRAIDRILLEKGPDIQTIKEDKFLTITVRGTKTDISTLFKILKNRMRDYIVERQKVKDESFMEMDLKAYLFHILIPVSIRYWDANTGVTGAAYPV